MLLPIAVLVLCDLAGIVGAPEGLLAGSLAVAGPPYVVFAALSLGYLWRRSVLTHVRWALFAPWLFVPFLCTYLAANDVLGPTANDADSRALLFTGLFMSLSTGYMYVAMLVPFALWWNADRSWGRDVARGGLAILCAVGLSTPAYLVASAGAVTSLPYLVEQAYSPSGEVVARLHALPEHADAPYGGEVRMARASPWQIISLGDRVYRGGCGFPAMTWQSEDELWLDCDTRAPQFTRHAQERWRSVTIRYRSPTDAPAS